MKVTLIGDSIRQIGYGTVVPKLLGDDFEVFQPDDNCRFAKYTLRGLFDWQNDMAGSRIVHWNNGLWDICNLFGDGLFTSETEFCENMLRIADILTSRYEKVIFATITPVREENTFNKNEDIRRYNEIIVPKLESRGVIINDLYTPLAEDINRYIKKEDLIHLTDEGIALCAKQTADLIRETAKTLGDESGAAQSGNNAGVSGAPV